MTKESKALPQKMFKIAAEVKKSADKSSKVKPETNPNLSSNGAPNAPH
ncbi:hypothetical protein [Candidatus Nitrotoga sp. AM1P]|nr:hypothetical protein [Candidatus Nitrotoga sp. AM1P]